jgi:hypothetical protein
VDYRLLTYSSFPIAHMGQTPAQVPHPMHFSGSIANFPSFGAIAHTGQTPAQVPHPTHFCALILYAIKNSFF